VLPDLEARRLDDDAVLATFWCETARRPQGVEA
jgi:hypothetical protein